MQINIENLKFQCILGILDFERVSPQDIIVNIEINYEYKNEFINYAHVTDLVKSQMKNEKFLLIEEALSHLDRELKEKFPLIKTLKLKIAKPSILPDCMVSVSNFSSSDS